MYLPNIYSNEDEVSMITEFKGLNKNVRIAEDEWSDMKNITLDYYPVIANRRKRGIVRNLTKPQGIAGGQYLTYVDDNKLYYDEVFVCNLNDTDDERQIVTMGAYICVFPDGIMYNTYDGSVTEMDNTVTTAAAPTFTLCKMDGTVFNSSNTVTSTTEPSDHTKYWIDTSADPVVIKMYSNTYSAWVNVGTTYVKVEATGIGEGFKKYDAAEFSGVDKDIPEIYNGYDFNQVNIIYDRGDDYLIIVGLINKIFTNSKVITVSRQKPDMDFICELNNRIWGCSSANHEVYACKLGDPTNWRCYAGLDSDSYAATVGSQGDFTGCIGYSNMAFFFKEDGFHKVYGSKPSNFEVTYRPGRGVQFGSDKSIAIVGDYLYFKARDAVCVYDGSTESVSMALGRQPYYDAIAEGYRGKYYISMRDEDYNYSMFVFDTEKGTWVKEDNLIAKHLIYAASALYVIDYDNRMFVTSEEKILLKRFPSDELIPGDDIYPGNSVTGTLEGDFEWSLTTGDIGLGSPYYKYIKRLEVRIQLETNAKATFEIEYDSSGDWEVFSTYFATRKRSFTIPIPVKRCDHLKLRISGEGDMKIFSIAKVIEEGGDGDGCV